MCEVSEAFKLQEPMHFQMEYGAYFTYFICETKLLVDLKKKRFADKHAPLNSRGFITDLQFGFKLEVP